MQAIGSMTLNINWAIRAKRVFWVSDIQHSVAIIVGIPNVILYKAVLLLNSSAQRTIKSAVNGLNAAPARGTQMGNMRNNIINFVGS